MIKGASRSCWFSLSVARDYNMQAAADFARRANQLIGFECGASSAALKIQRESLYQTAKFMSRFNLIGPSGPRTRIFFLRKSEIMHDGPIPPHQEGRYGQSSRNVRRGCGGRFGLRTTIAGTADGEDAWS
jgi:hypothetical protein